MIQKIISGGQSGADMGGLLAGRDLGIPTGGEAPFQFMTETGPQPDLLQSFGLVEHGLDYPQRTRRNIQNSDGTIVFGHLTGGTKLTVDMAIAIGKPVFVVLQPDDGACMIPHFRRWLAQKEIAVLNVAGNRESKYPGIQEQVRAFLVQALHGDAG